MSKLIIRSCTAKTMDKPTQKCMVRAKPAEVLKAEFADPAKTAFAREALRERAAFVGAPIKS